MKALLINTVCGIKSTGRICCELAKKLEIEGYEVKIAYGREEVPDEYLKYAVRIGGFLDYNSHALMSRIFDNAGFGSIRATREFIKWAEKFNPDLLWLHNLHGYYINIKILFDWIKKRPNMKVKWTLHDCWPFTGHCTHFTMAKCDKWCIGCEKCCQKKAYPTSYLMDASKRNYKRKKEIFTGVSSMELITPSEWLKQQVKQSFLSEYKVTVINNTIDKNIFKKVKSDFKAKRHLEDKVIVLAVSSGWGPKKGLQDCIRISEKLDQRFKIVIVGLTKKQIVSIPDNILCIERTNNIEELVKIYSDADVFINTTHEDNYPTVNLEARACGLPVITYNVGGSPESAGYEHVVEENNIDGVVKEIENICKEKIVI